MCYDIRLIEIEMAKIIRIHVHRILFEDNNEIGLEGNF